MKQTVEAPSGQQDYQAAFAQRLIKAVGYQDAVRECYENQWLGTLIHVERLHQLYDA